MRKKVIYLGIGIVILGIILVLMGIFVMSDTGLYMMSGNYGAFSFLLALRSIMNWAGIILSIGGAVAIIYGVYLDEQVPVAIPNSKVMYHQQESFHPVETRMPQQFVKKNFCFQCGAELEGTPSFCYECGTKLR